MYVRGELVHSQMQVQGCDYVYLRKFTQFEFVSMYKYMCLTSDHISKHVCDSGC